MSMNEQDELRAMFRDSLERYVAQGYDFAARAAVLKSGAGHSERAWRDYAEFGWTALRVPAEDGGIGADAATLGDFMQIVGSRLLLEPVFASIVVGTQLLAAAARPEQRARWMPEIAQGRLKLAVAIDEGCTCSWADGRLSGRAIAVLHADIADRLVVAARDAGRGNAWCLLLADPAAPGLRRERIRLVDGRSAAHLHFDGVAAELLQAEGAEAAIAQARDEAAVALCAELLGALRRLVTLTNEYLKVRQQFGRAIGSNQVLQHRMAELFILQEEASALTAAAQQALSLPLLERQRLISGAKAYVGRAARKVANEAIQMHGGIGVTEELEVSHLFRRIMVANAMFGSPDAQLLRFAAANEAQGRASCATM